MNVSLSRIITLIAVVAFVCVAAVLVVTVYYPLVQERNALLEKRNDLLRLNRAMEKEIAELKRNQVMFENDPAFVEITARNENKARADEVVFVFEP